MLEKVQVLTIYALVGLSIALWPILIRFMPATYGVPRGLAKFSGANSVLAVLFCLFFIATPLLIAFSTTSSLPIVALVVVCALIAIRLAFHQRRFALMTAMYTFAALLLTITLPWWRRGQLTWLEVILFTAIMLIVIEIIQKTPLWPIKLWVKSAQNVVFLIIVIALSFVTSQLHDEPLLIAWHHWGAYIGPSELLLAGARLFLDIPAQYGLGPTLMIASVCGQNCWVGMYYLVGSATALFAIFIAYIALGILAKGGGNSGIPRWLVLALCVICCFFWAGNPSNVSLPLAFPSQSGLRFLPILVLVTVLIQIDNQLQNKTYATVIGHVGWCLVTLWSPESGFYATCVWWPYYLLLQCTKSKSQGEIIASFFRALGVLLLVAACLVAIFVTAYKLVYGTLPIASTLFIYALNPPGPLPIDFNGTIWFFISLVALAFINNWQIFKQSGNTALFRRGFLLLLLAYSTFSYFLGRSHDNNILNIAPFMLLVLLHCFSTSAAHTSRAIATALLAALIGWSSTFGWYAWHPSSERLSNIAFDPSWVNAAISDGKLGTANLTVVYSPFPDDATRALEEIQRDTLEPATVVVNTWNGLSSTNSEAVWSGFHGPANIAMFPSATRRIFLTRTANTLRRSGWLIISQSQLHSALIADFDSVYLRTAERDFGTFHAIRYVPQ